jgi:hypothetical protein
MIPAKNRERKCSTCKHYQPSPLWRKGWCRNPLLYDRNTNHLVEADSLACNRTFIDYWEPVQGPMPAAGPQARSGKPRIAPSIPMDTTDSQGNRDVVTGNTSPSLAAARPLYKPATTRDRPPLSLVTPDFDDDEDLQDTAKVTREIEQIEGPDDEPVAVTARQRIQQARAKRRPGLLSLSRMQLLIVLGVAALLITVGVGAFFATRPRDEGIKVPGAVPSPSVDANAAVPTPTGFGDPTATVPATTPEATAVVPPPTDKIGIGGWVQVSANSLNVREEASTSAKVVTALRFNTKAHVVEGPVEANDLTWWKIDQFDAADPARTGWCAASFLEPTTPPAP